MSHSVGPLKKGRADFDVNIVPIVDAFVILIVFMMASGAFLKIGTLDVGVSAGGQSVAEKQNPPAIDIQVQMDRGNRLVLVVSGKESRTVRIPKTTEGFNQERLMKELNRLKGRYPKVKSITLAASKGVTYESLVNAMAVARKSHPDVLLGGF